MSGSKGFQIWTVSSELKIASGASVFKILLTQRPKKNYLVMPTLVKYQVFQHTENCWDLCRVCKWGKDLSKWR